MKLTKPQLKEMVRNVIRKKLNEKFDVSKDLVPEGVAEFSSKVEDFIKETVEKAQKLKEEGEGIMTTNILSSYEVQERNRFLLYHVGFLSNLIANLLHRMEDAHRQ